MWEKWENPIFTKELRTRMRGSRAFTVLFLYAGVLALILFLVYVSWWSSQRSEANYSGTGYGNAAFEVGRTFYGVLFTIQALLVGLITPSLTAGGISLEKEQRTFELLQVSRLRPGALVQGKLFAAVAFVGLLLTSSLPLVALCFLLGGVSPGEVGAAYVLLLVCAFLYGAVGIGYSSVAKTTSAATTGAFGGVLLLFFITLPLTLMASAGYYMGMPGGMSTAGLSALNPIGAVTAGTARESYFGLTFPAWLTGIVLNGLLGVIFTIAATNRVEQGRGGGSDRVGVLRVLTAVYVGLLSFCLYGLFLPGAAIHGSLFALVRMSAAPTLGATPYIMLLAPLALCPVFCTGDGLPAKLKAWAWMDPRRLRRGEALSGLLYCLLLTLLSGLILLVGAKWGPGGAQFASLAAPIGHLLVLTAATTAMLGALGLLLSAVTQSRNTAQATLLTVGMLLYCLSAFIGSHNLAQINHAPSPWDNMLYLSPLPGASELAGGRSPQAPGAGRYLLAGALPFYQVTPMVYGGMTVLFLWAASKGDFRRRRRLPTPVEAPVDILPPTSA